MRSRATKRFRACYRSLPPDIQARARACYRLWSQDHRHPSLRFKQLQLNQSIYSARVGIGWRSLAIRDGDTFIWFWIGSHAEYDRLISNL